MATNAGISVKCQTGKNFGSEMKGGEKWPVLNKPLKESLITEHIGGTMVKTHIKSSERERHKIRNR